MKMKRGMPVIVDTNVPITANQKAQDDLPCADRCANELLKITKDGTLLIDEGNLIFDEYKKHLNFSGQPGPGDVFFKWLADNRYNSNFVLKIRLEPVNNCQGQFAAFPADPDLQAFDPADRKFVALARSHPDCPEILNATDRDWWDFQEALQWNHVRVRHLCGTERFQRR